MKLFSQITECVRKMNDLFIIFFAGYIRAEILQQCTQSYSDFNLLSVLIRHWKRHVEFGTGMNIASMSIVCKMLELFNL